MTRCPRCGDGLRLTLMRLCAEVDARAPASRLRPWARVDDDCTSAVPSLLYPRSRVGLCSHKRNTFSSTNGPDGSRLMLLASKAQPIPPLVDDGLRIVEPGGLACVDIYWIYMYAQVTLLPRFARQCSLPRALIFHIVHSHPSQSSRIDGLYPANIAMAQLRHHRHHHDYYISCFVIARKHTTVLYVQVVVARTARGTINTVRPVAQGSPRERPVAHSCVLLLPCYCCMFLALCIPRFLLDSLSKVVVE